MKIKKNENGFGLVEVLLVILIIGLIGGAGYYIYNSKQNENDKSQLTVKQEDMDVKTSTGETFEFKELGVSIDASGAIENLKYDVIPAVGQASEQYSLTTDEIDTLFTKCVKENGDKINDQYFSIIFKTEGNYADDLSAAQEANDRPSFPKLLKQFNGYYIAASNPTDDRYGACMGTTNDAKYRAMIADAQKSLASAFEDAKESQN